jgi:hypothetical protein
MQALPMAPVSAAPARKSRMRGRSKALPSLQGSQKSGDAGLPPAPGSFEEGVDRRRLSEDILCEGYVQSFVDFFYLTHRPEPNADITDAAEGTPEIQVPSKEMLYVRDNLTSAENARRQGDTGTVYGSYSNLAQHYHVRWWEEDTVFFFFSFYGCAASNGGRARRAKVLELSSLTAC